MKRLRAGYEYFGDIIKLMFRSGRNKRGSVEFDGTSVTTKINDATVLDVNAAGASVVGTFSADTIAEKTSGSGVTVDGVLIKDGTITTTAPVIKSVAPAITAFAGGGKGSATALTEEINIVTTCATRLDSVLLPAAAVGLTVTIANLGATGVAVYAAGTNTIDDVLAANYVVIEPEDVVTFRAYTTAKWQSDFEGEGVYDKISVIAPGVTTGDAAAITLTNQTSGNGLIITGGGAGTLTGGSLINLENSGATTGSMLEIFNTTGVYTSAEGMLNIDANSATTGTIVDINAVALTTGKAINIASNGNTALYSNGSYESSLNTDVALPAPAAGTITAQEFGDGAHHITVLTLSAMQVGSVAAAALAIGQQIYELPAGVQFFHVSDINLAFDNDDESCDADDPVYGIGSVVGSGAVGVLNGTAAFMDYHTEQTSTNCDGTVGAVSGPLAPTAGFATGAIALNTAASEKSIFLNCAETWTGTTNITATGTITLVWDTLR